MVLEMLIGLHSVNWLFTLRKMKSNFFFLCLAPTLLCAAVQSCSSYCTCGEDLANCKSVPSLQAVFIDLPKSMATILLQGGSITMIEPRAFQNFSNLRYLSITDFRLSLSSHAFAASVGSQSRLQVLDLSKNRLLSCNITGSAFAGLSNLTELNLFQNVLDALKTLWFSDLTSLQRLNVQLNKISYLPPRIFLTLSLLDKLNVSSNLIQYLSTDTFCGLNTLRYLDLSSNKLLFIAKDAFKPLQRLKHLFLNDNQLVTLAEVPGSLQEIQLQGNPWECSCQLEMLLGSWRDAVQDPGSLVCGSPESLKGKPILIPGSSYCLSTAPVPETPALHIVPVLSARAVVYGFIGGFLLAGAICLVTCVGKRSWREGTMGSLRIHSSEAKGRLETRRMSEALMELDASKQKGVSVIVSHQTINEMQNIKDKQEEQREEPLNISTESWTARKRENNAEKSRRMRPCKTSPSSLHAAYVAHMQTVGVNSAVKNKGRSGSWGKAEREKVSIDSATSYSFHNLNLTKKGQVKLISSRTPQSLNVKPAPNTISVSVQDWSSMNKGMPNVTFPHLLPGDIQTHVRLQTSLQSNSKCKPQEKIQDDIPCKANVSKAEGATFQAAKSLNEHKENDTLQLLEVDGKFRDKLPEYQEILPRNIQNVSSISMQTPTCLPVSHDAFSEISHQQARHLTPFSHYGEEPRSNPSEKHRSPHHSESPQFTNQPKSVLDTDFSESDTVKVENNDVSFTTRADATPPGIIIFAQDEHKQPRHHSPCKQKFTKEMSEHVFNEIETPIREDSFFMDDNQLSDGDRLELNNTLPKESVSLVGSSAGPTFDDILAASRITEDKMNQDGSASISFSRPFAWSAESQENWNQSTITLDSASEHPERNHSQKFTSNAGAPKQSITRITDEENNLDVEEWTDRSETSFQNRFSTNIPSINGKPNSEPEGCIQCPIIRHSQKLLYKNDAGKRMGSELYRENFGNINYSKKMYKSVFKLIDEMQFQPSLEEVQNKVLQNKPILNMGVSRDKPKLHNVLSPLSTVKTIKALQQFKSSGPALELPHLSSLYSRWYYKSEFRNRFRKQIPTIVPEGVDLNTMPNFHCEKNFRSPTDNQTHTEDEEATDVRARKDIHSPKHFVKLSPPMQKELLTDDELTVINLFHNLKKTLVFE